MVSGQLPPRKIAPWLGLGLGLGSIFLGSNCPRTGINNEVKKAVFSFTNLFAILRLAHF